jgi:hypothetical protein
MASSADRGARDRGNGWGGAKGEKGRGSRWVIKLFVLEQLGREEGWKYVGDTDCFSNQTGRTAHDPKHRLPYSSPFPSLCPIPIGALPVHDITVYNLPASDSLPFSSSLSISCPHSLALVLALALLRLLPFQSQSSLLRLPKHKLHLSPDPLSYKTHHPRTVCLDLGEEERDVCAEVEEGRELGLGACRAGGEVRLCEDQPTGPQRQKYVWFSDQEGLWEERRREMGGKRKERGGSEGTNDADVVLEELLAVWAGKRNGDEGGEMEEAPEFVGWVAVVLRFGSGRDAWTYRVKEEGYR